jgi:hypothetical protein
MKCCAREGQGGGGTFVGCRMTNAAAEKHASQAARQGFTSLRIMQLFKRGSRSLDLPAGEPLVWEFWRAMLAGHRAPPRHPNLIYPNIRPGSKD